MQKQHFKHAIPLPRKRGSFLAVLSVNFLMHRVIVAPLPLFEIDHINGDRLDNRRENLRVVTREENQANRKKMRSYSRYKGVFVERRFKTLRWRAKIQVNGRVHYLGVFDTEIQAAKAYNEAALRFSGSYARINVIEEADAV